MQDPQYFLRDLGAFAVKPLRSHSSGVDRPL
jgi:hypothetical protein